MSIASRLRHEKQPSPESGRPRLRGKREKPAPIDVSAFQQMLHEQSSKARSRPRVTKGAFGGCTKGERYERVARRAAK